MNRNEHIPEPKSPGRWIDQYRCVCGAEYKNFRLFSYRTSQGNRFSEACNRVRLANGERGGFRSRGAVLWALRVMKLQAWYDAHYACSYFHRSRIRKIKSWEGLL